MFIIALLLSVGNAYSFELPVRVELPLQDVLKIEETARHQDPEGYDVLEVKLSDGSSASCMTIEKREDYKTVECFVGDYPIDRNGLDQISKWSRQREGTHSPALLDDPYGYGDSKYICSTDGEFEPTGKCLFVHNHLNPKALIVKGGNKAFEISVARGNRVVRVDSERFCVEAESSDKIAKISGQLESVELEPIANCNDYAKRVQGKHAFGASITGTGLIVDTKDLEKLFETLGTNSSTINEYLVTGHGTEGGVVFCLESTTQENSEQLKKAIADIKLNRRQSERYFTEQETCERSERRRERWTRGKRNTEKEKLAEAGVEERAKARLEKLKEDLDEKARELELQKVSSEFFKLALAEIKKRNDEVVSSYATHIDYGGEGELNIRAEFNLKSGGMCAILHDLKLRRVESGVQLSHPLKLICFPRSGNEKTAVIPLKTQVSVKENPKLYFENEYIKLISFYADAIGKGISKAEWYQPSSTERSRRMISLIQFSADAFDGEICEFEREEEPKITPNPNEPGTAWLNELLPMVCYSDRNQGGYSINETRRIPIAEEDLPIKVNPQGYVFQKLEAHLREIEVPKLRRLTEAALEKVGIEASDVKNFRLSPVRIENPEGLEVRFAVDSGRRSGLLCRINGHYKAFFYRSAEGYTFSRPLVAECRLDRKEFEVPLLNQYRPHPNLNATHDRLRKFIETEFTSKMIKLVESKYGELVISTSLKLYEDIVKADRVLYSIRLDIPNGFCRNYSPVAVIEKDGQQYLPPSTEIHCRVNDKPENLFLIEEGILPALEESGGGGWFD